MVKQDKASEILDCAEKMVRQLGYNGFSYRDIAEEVGVKSSSVHYHFSTKEELGESLVRRYTQRFLDSLGKPEEQVSAQSALDKYVALFKRALLDDNLMCLCGIMGAEHKSLPNSVRLSTKIFFEENLKWLQDALLNAEHIPSKEQGYQMAVSIIATLEGAMILSQALNNEACFEAAIAGLPRLINL